MRSEYLDKKVQEAAEKHHPAYDEKAWQKMEKLLNQHLPVQRDDDRRRFFLLLFFFLLLGGGAYVLISKPWDTDTEIASRSNANNEKVLDKSNSTPNDKSANEGQSINANAVDAIPPFAKDVATTQSIKISSRENRREKSVIPGVPPGLINRGEKNEVSKNQVDKRNLSVTNDETITTPELSREIKPDQRPIDSKKVTDNNQNLLNNAVTKQTESISKQETPKIETSNVQVQQTATKPPIHKDKSSRRSGFAFLLSAGPDVSKAGGSDPGKLTLAYGAGISYTRNRFTLRTGVYGARKIYKAGPADYKLPYQPQNIKFVGTDANCYVMEIPITLLYNFASKNRGNWFAGAGLSSYIMKSEIYNNEYKTTTGAPLYYRYEVKNENKHYFSVVDLSAGYNLRLNNTLSLSAEPYIKIPLSGIGVGKVQLNSGGVLFTLGIKPFKK